MKKIAFFVLGFNIFLSSTLVFSAPTDYKVTNDGTVYSYDLITKGPWIDARAYSSLAAANTAAYDAGKTLVIAQNYILTANTTLTASVRVIKGGQFTKASTYILTISGPFETGPHKVFSGFSSGDVTFGPGTVKEVHPQWWGATGDGVTDDTVAFMNAAATLKPIFVPDGTYLLSNLTLTNVPYLIGVPGRSILKAKAGIVGNFITIVTSTNASTGYPYISKLTGLSIDGSNTTNLVGLYIHDVNIFIEDFELYSFATGIDINSCVDIGVKDSIITKNGTNVQIRSGTTMSFRKSNIREASAKLGSGIGFNVISAANLIIDDCIIESNDKEGIKVVIGTNQKANISVTNSWFENNQASEAMRSNYYHIYLDGSRYGRIGMIDFRMGDTFMSLSALNPKAVFTNRVQHFDIGKLFLTSGAQANIFNFTNYSYGDIILSFVSGGLNYIVKDSTSMIRVNNPYPQTLAVNNTTPDVSNGTLFRTANTNPTTIIDLDNMPINNKIIILIQDGNTHFDFTGTNLKGNGGVDWDPAKGDWMECFFDGGYKYCSVHDTTS